jgi:hypothetical protein
VGHVSAEVIDLGHGHTIQMAVWDPDLDLNPQYAHLAGQFPATVSAIIRHKMSDGEDCEGVITFDVPVAHECSDGPFWQVESWEPLTLSPSLLCHCGDHGFIKQGRWVLG